MDVAFWGVAMALNGYALLCLLNNKKNRVPGLPLFFAVGGTVVAAVLIALVLGLLGFYSMAALATVLFAAAAAQWGYLIFKKKLFTPGRLFATSEASKSWIIVCILLVACFVLYLCFPTYYWYAGRDHGLYVVNGVHLAKTGSLFYGNDALRAEVYEALKGNLMVEPGFYSAYEWGLSEIPSSVVPQFMPMYFAASAIGYDIAGLAGVFRVNGVITILALLAVYFFCSLLFSKATGVIAMLILALNPAQLWNGRIPGSEMLSQLLLFFSLVVWFFAWQEKRRAVAVLAGTLLGVSVICRVDSLIYCPAACALWMYACLFDRGKEPVARFFTLSFFCAALLSVLYGLIGTLPYMAMLWETGTLVGLAGLNVAMLLCSTAVAFITKKRCPPDGARQRIATWVERRAVRGGIAVFLLLLFCILYWVRPLMNREGPDTIGYLNANAMVEFCWYTSVALVVQAILAAYHLPAKGNIDRGAAFLFLLLGFSCLLVYIYHPSITPDHFWASRRWITAAIPFVAVLGGYGCSWIAAWNGPPKMTKMRSGKYLQMVAALLCVAVVCVFSLYQSRLFLFRPMLEGTDRQLEALAGALDPEGLYISDCEPIVAPLQYIHDAPVYQARSGAELPEKVAGRAVYVLSAKKPLPSLHNNYEWVDNYEIAGIFPEMTWNRYPTEVFDWDLSVGAYRVSYSEKRQVVWDPMDYDSFQSQNRMESLWCSDGRAGVLLYGPYLWLQPGDYLCTWDLKLHTSPGNTQTGMCGWVEVSANDGNDSLAMAEIPIMAFEDGMLRISLPFSYLEDAKYEFRVFAEEGVHIEVLSMELSTG